MEPSKTGWNAPKVFAPKEDGFLRSCVDYWELNAVLLCDPYPIQRMDKCIDWLGDALIFSKLHTNCGY